MIDYFVQSMLSNCVIAASLAVIALFVQRRIRSATLANLLWAIVLVKLVTPPLVSVEFFEIPQIASYQSGTRDDSESTIDGPRPERWGNVNIAAKIPIG